MESTPPACFQRASSAAAGAGSAITTRCRSGSRRSSQACRRKPGSRGSPSVRRSENRTSRTPCFSGGSHATRSGARMGSSPTARVASSRGSSLRARRRRDAGMPIASQLVGLIPSGRWLSIHRSRIPSSIVLDASRRKTRRLPGTNGQGSSAGADAAEASPFGVSKPCRPVCIRRQRDKPGVKRRATFGEPRAIRPRWLNPWGECPGSQTGGVP